MAKVEKCPVCNGDGKIWQRKHYPGVVVTSGWQICHGCNGKGWIAVPERDCKKEDAGKSSRS